MEGYNALTSRIKAFEQQHRRKQELKRQAQQRMKEELNQLHQNFEERNNTMISKMEELKRKETILITLKRIEPEVPQGFPKNYFCQIAYEDTLFTGSQKFTDFDENVIEEKFVLPLLFSSSVKVEIWIAQEEPSLWAKAEIDLEKDIESALIGEACQGELAVGQGTDQAKITYRLQLQGIGFSTWLRNIIEIRELEAEKAYSREQGQVRKEEMRAKVQEKKSKFKGKFHHGEKKQTTQYNATNLDKLIEELNIGD